MKVRILSLVIPYIGHFFVLPVFQTGSLQHPTLPVKIGRQTLVTLWLRLEAVEEFIRKSDQGYDLAFRVNPASSILRFD